MKEVFKICILIIGVLLFGGCKEEEASKRDEANKMENPIKPEPIIPSLPLPLDTGGAHLAKYLLPEVNIYGHYLYLPNRYRDADTTQKYPLIIFLHGMGEKGNSATDSTQLSKILIGGIPMLIEQKAWKPGFPAIVASPQCHDGWWDYRKIHQFIEYIIANYPINKDKIYMTGLSMGGYGTYEYISAYGDLSYVAAAVPICGGGDDNKALSFLNTPVWAFHGEADSVVSVNKSIEMVEAINKTNPRQKAKLTIYPGIGHVSWDITYDGTGMGKESKAYDSFSEDIFSWMFRHSKDSLTKVIEEKIEDEY